MRVSSGIYRSIILDTIDSNETRPTLAKVKEAIFSMLNHNLVDDVILDLFAGSGSLGIEALSNGAAWVDFNDTSYSVQKVLSQNLSKVKATNFSLSQTDYKTYLKQCTKKYDIILLDPPYHLQIIDHLLELIKEYNLLKPSGIIICEYQIDELIKNEYFEIIKDKKYGKTKVTFFKERL